MTVDAFEERVARVRQRFVASLPTKIEATYQALPNLSGSAPSTLAAVAEAYRCIHGMVGIGRTVGFPATGLAAQDVENVLRPPYQAGRGLTAGEIDRLTKSLHGLRETAARELQAFNVLSE